MVGQIAAPWQSMWCFLHLKNISTAGDSLHDATPFLAPEVLINEAYDYLIAHQWKWACASNAGFQKIKLSVPSEPSYQVTLSKRTRVEEVVLAHSKLTRSTPGLVAATTVELQPEYFVSGDLWMTTAPLEKKEALVQVDFQHGDCHTLISGPAGSYLFQLAQGWL